MADQDKNRYGLSEFTNFKIDISNWWDSKIKPIDDSRSESVPFTGKLSKDNYICPAGSYIQDPANGTAGKSESLCHAYYRFIGLPVVAPDGSYYSPGIDDPDQTGSSNTATKLDRKIGISNEFISSSLAAISDAREKRVIDGLDLFKIKDISSGVAALSLMNPRFFVDPLLQESAVFSLTDQSQQYNLSFKDPNKDNMLQYLDKDGNLPERISSYFINNKSYHYIRPFMIDPRIFFSAGEKKQWRVPFLSNLSNSTANKYPNPYIEDVIKARLSGDTYEDSIGDYEVATMEYVKSLDSDSNFNLSISNSLLSAVYGKSSLDFEGQYNFFYFVNFCRSMCKQLKSNIDTLTNSKIKYYWFPLVNPLGPYLGCVPNKIEFDGKQNISQNTFFTSNDIKIITAHYRDVIENIDRYVSQVATTFADQQSTKTSSYATNTIDPFSDSKVAKPPTDTIVGIKGLTNERLKVTREACDAIKNIELIMGEFTGFGICDAIVLDTALFLVDINSLVGLIDKDAQIRMSGPDYADKIKMNTSPKDVITSLSDYETVVRNLYSLMDAIFTKVLQEPLGE